MKILVTGAGGQLGRDLVEVLADDEVVGLTRADLDVTDEAAVDDAVARHRPEVVINTASWTDVDGCEADPARAHLVNAVGPWWVARACARWGATLVQLSTDYVFDGAAPEGPDGRPRAYTEFDRIAPLNVYGRSKAAGEHLVREALPRHHIVRTAWLFGRGGDNFVTTMLRLASERDELVVVTDQHGSPTYTRDLAVAIRRLAASGRYGTVNLTGAGRCSRFEFAAAVFELSGVEVDLEPATSAQFDRPASRPAWSVLDGTHASLSGLDPLPHWRDALARFLAELEAKGELT